jgi:uncharacterized membrane protein YidH (DUF202 family)
MYACPHCSQLSFSGWRKFGASSSLPASCPRCRGLAYVSGWVHGLSTLVLQTALIGSALVALHFHSWLVFAVLFASAVCAQVLAVASYSTLRPIAREGVKRDRGITVLVFIALVVVLVVVNATKSSG